MRRLRLLALVVLTTLTAAACARNVELNADAGDTYAVNIINEMPHAMVISFDNGQTTNPLGTVGADRQERFIIVGAEGGTITLIATDEADTHTVRRTVTLMPDDVVDVRIN